MFIERSAGRIRLARLTFLAIGLVPCLLLAAWAWHRGSPGHRDAIRRAWQQAVGMPVEIEAVTHPRPGVVVATGCTVRSPTGRTVLQATSVEVESADGEDRIRLGGARVDAEAAAVLGDLAREWLRSDARHPRNCVIEVPVLDGAGLGGDAQGLRAECVGHVAARAIRVVRTGGEGELRVVRTLEGEGPAAVERFEIDAHFPQPVPAALCAAVAGAGEAAGRILARATVTGDLHATWGAAAGTGSAEGRITGIDVAACCAAVSARGAGLADVAVRRMAWRDGRVTDVALEGAAGAGWIDAALFERFVVALGCRPGPAASGATGVRSFDLAGVVVDLDGGRLLIQAGAGMADAIAVTGGGVLLRPPQSAVAFDRVAWMASPPTAQFVPAAGPGAWLMSIGPAAAEAGSRATAPAPDGRRGF